MTLKTPEQIALDAILLNYNGREGLSESLVQGDVDADGIEAMIAAAIEADRAQRRIPFDTLDHMLNAWDHYDGEVSSFMDAWLSHFNEGADVPEWAKA